MSKVIDQYGFTKIVETRGSPDKIITPPDAVPLSSGHYQTRLHRTLAGLFLTTCDRSADWKVG